MSHPNEELLRSWYKAQNEKDFDLAAEYVTDDVVWHTAPGMGFGDIHGKQDVRTFWGRVTEMADTMAFEVHDVLANDEHVVGLVRVRGQRGDKTLEAALARMVEPA
jgi:uncharacterized protein